MIDQLSQEVSIRRTIPAYYRVEDSDTSHFVMTDEFLTQFDSTVTHAEIDKLNAKYGIEVAPIETEIDEYQARERNEYVLRVTEESEYNALEAANLYHENPRTRWAAPNFFVDVRFLANDPLYSEQYYLHNTSSNLGTEDVDIDAPEAWNHTKGSSSITVAVLDAGVEQHEDFYSGQLVNGKTFGQSGDGSPNASDENHGQAVAGIVAANHNSKGVRGVAPNVEIMPINIADADTEEEFANAIDYAWQNGADVLNNSYGTSPNSAMESAIANARQKGRNGKGSVVVAAYMDNFAGTSATAPQASGVAALMLSLESHLGESEVRQIIRDEAVDYGSSDWTGDGLLNAVSAVRRAATPAAPTNLEIANAGQVGAHPNLDWDDNTEPDLDHYNVFRCTSYYTSCSWSKIAETTSSEYTDTFVIIKEKEDANDRYDYYVSAVDTDDYESDGSNIASTWGTQPLLRGPEEEDQNPTPDAFALHAPAPNPVETQTTVQVDVPETRRVTVTVYDVMGRQVAQMAHRTMTPGFHHLSVHPDQWPSGVYFVRMTAGSFTATRRLTVVR